MQFDSKFGIKKLLKSKGIGFVLIGIVAGIILLLLPQSEKEEISTTNNIITSEEYCQNLEHKAEELIKQLPNVNKCDVFITLECGFQYVYATDQHVREGQDTKETDKTIVLASQSNNQNPIILQETMPKIAGVAIVCPNASYDTQYRIVELMSALFAISTNRISVQN